jgi:hypothetical protein
VIALVYFRRHRRNKAFFGELVHNLLPENESQSVSQIRERGVNQITEQIVVHDSMIPFDEIELGPQVGEGSYALVHKAKFKSMEVAGEYAPCFTLPLC